MPRREFTKAVKVQIIKRATRELYGTPQQWCEQCGGWSAGRFQIDHTIPDGLEIDKSRKLTADDGQLLCFKCHDEKTDKDKGNIAKAKRIEAKHIGADRPKGTIPNRGFPKSDRPHRDRQSLPTKGLFK